MSVAETTPLQRRGGRARGLANGTGPQPEPPRRNLSTGPVRGPGAIDNRIATTGTARPWACPLSTGTESAFDRNCVRFQQEPLSRITGMRTLGQTMGWHGEQVVGIWPGWAPAELQRTTFDAIRSLLSNLLSRGSMVCPGRPALVRPDLAPVEAELAPVEAELATLTSTGPLLVLGTPRPECDKGR